MQGRGNLLGLVIDLRENSGGFLRQAIKVSELFIDKGIIVISKYSQGKMSYAANLKENAFYKGPLVLLLSKASASAAEIFAQALQDYGVALIAGDDRSYGKGSMQHQTLTDPSARFFFKVTVGRYYTASGRSPQIQGVQTDIAVPTRYFPYRIGERYLAFPLAKDHLSFDLFQALKKVRQGGDSIFPSLLVPYLKPRESKWRKMLPTLMANSSKRITKDLNFQLFLTKGKLLQMQRGRELFSPETSVGQGDLQMEEALMIVKDIISIDQKNRSTLSTK